VLSGVASTAWQLWRTSESLRDSGRRKDDFIATLAHELRGPFAAIQCAESVLRHTRTGADVTPVLDVIQRQGSHVARLVDDLLDVARVGAGKLVLNRRVVDLRTVIVETVQAGALRPTCARHDLQLDLGDDPILIEADPVRLTQIVSNLVDNARKYTPVDGRISVGLRRSKDEVVFEVRDTGIGIPADRVDSIFEPFTQLASAQPGGGPPGLGLGLPLVRRYTELHGGDIRVTSAGPGRGSCFTIRLPAGRAAVAGGESDRGLQTAS
jgi:signal transduction histidine kinase